MEGIGLDQHAREGYLGDQSGGASHHRRRIVTMPGAPGPRGRRGAHSARVHRAILLDPPWLNPVRQVAGLALGYDSGKEASAKFTKDSQESSVVLDREARVYARSLWMDHAHGPRESRAGGNQGMVRGGFPSCQRAALKRIPLGGTCVAVIQLRPTQLDQGHDIQGT